jgi:hypothetical protein
MKKIFLKSVITLATALLLCNCGDVTSSNATNYVVTSQSFLYESDGADYIIDQATGIVTNAETGEVIGFADFNTGRIIAPDQVTVLEEGIVFSELEQLTPPVITSDAWVLSADDIYVIYPGTFHVTDANGNTIGAFVFDTDPDTGLPAVDPETGMTTTSGSIVDANGEVLVKNVDIATLKPYQATVNPNGGNVNPGIESSESAIPGPQSSDASNLPYSSE